MNKLSQYYFAYGSNLNLNDFNQWCVQNHLPDARLIPRGTALLPDYRLAFSHKSVSRGGGALNIEPYVGGVVEGVLFEVDGADGWQALDRKEGAPRHYERVTVTVTQESGDTETAVSYINPRVVGQYVKPTDEYVKLVKEGLGSFQLSDRDLKTTASNRDPRHFTDAVFVYGDLMRGQADSNILRQLGIKYITSAECFGTLLLANAELPVLHHPARGSSQPRAYAEGEFVRLNNLNSSLKHLDGFFAGLRPNIHGFNLTRKIKQVCLGGKKVRWAWVYQTDTRCDQLEVITSGCWRTHLGEKDRFWSQLSVQHASSLNPQALEVLKSLNPWDDLRNPESGESRSDYLASLLSTGAITELRLLQASGRDIAVW